MIDIVYVVSYIVGAGCFLFVIEKLFKYYPVFAVLSGLLLGVSFISFLNHLGGNDDN